MNITKVTTIDDVSQEEILTSDNYSATIRLTPTPQDLEAFIRCGFYELNFKSGNASMMTTLNAMQGAFSDSFPFAARYLSILLVNDNADSVLPHTFALSNDIIGYAEGLIPYSGADTKRGTYNSAESYIRGTHGKLLCHYVFDFPTHAANGSFNKVLFYPELFHSHESSPVPGYVSNNGLEVKIAEFYMNHIDNIMSYTTSKNYQYYSLMCISDNGEYLVKAYNSKRVFGRLADGTKIEFPEIEGTPESTYDQYHTISYFNGSFWLSEKYNYRAGEGATTSLNALKLQVDATGVKTTGETLTFSLAGATYSGKYFKLVQVIQVDQLLFVFFHGNSSASNSATQYKNVAVYDTSYRLITSRISPITFGESLGHFYDPMKKVVYFTSNGAMVTYDVASSTFGTAFSYSSNSHLRESPTRTTNIAAYMPSIASSNSVQYDYNVRYCGPLLIGRGEFKKPVIEIDLEEPLNKTNVETLKLIFDFEITTD